MNKSLFAVFFLTLVVFSLQGNAQGFSSFLQEGPNAELEKRHGFSQQLKSRFAGAGKRNGIDYQMEKRNYFHVPHYIGDPDKNANKFNLDSFF